MIAKIPDALERAEASLSFSLLRSLKLQKPSH